MSAFTLKLPFRTLPKTKTMLGLCHPQNLVFVAFLWSLPPLSLAGNILVYPVDGSHWLNMDILLRELHTRGHKLTVMRSSNSWYIKENATHYTSITVPVSHISSLEDPEYMASFLRRNIDIQRNQGSIWSFMHLQKQLLIILEECYRSSAEMVRTILEDKKLVKKLKTSKYDLMLTDPGITGGVVLGAYLGLPMVLNVRWNINAEGHFAIAPSPLSYVPIIGSGVTDKMTFVNKLKNFLHYGIGQYIDHVITRPLFQEVISKYIDPGSNVYSLTQGADLWLIRGEFVFEFPRPTMPNVVYIGGFQCKPSKPLPAELETFVESSGEHGVVIMSLGTLLGSLVTDISEVVASAFAGLPQKVIWRHVGEKPSSLGNNTLIVDWLPQNDLLGHPKTKAFVTHGGTNGIYEAIYHGVPMLGLPLLFDQFDNMVRLQAKGVARVLDVTALDVDTLTQALKDILGENQPYQKNMHRMSHLYHDTPIKPMDSAIFWLEFVMRHKGAAHLRTESYKLPWYSYHNLDVLMLLVSLFMAICLFLILISRAVLKVLVRKIKAKKE